jgi:hypothetical protein
VAEILARSQASVHPSHQRGLPLPPADVRRTLAPVDRVANGTWGHDDERVPGGDLHLDHHRRYSPQPSPQQNEHFLHPDADAPAEQRPLKKAWELEVERLRLSMQQQHLSGIVVVVFALSSLTISQQDQVPYPDLQLTSARSLGARLLRSTLP